MAIPCLLFFYLLTGFHSPQSVQNRLIAENKTLSVERSHLSDLMSNVQKMHNDLDRAGENDRRRLENQIQMLENQRFVPSCDT